MLECGYFGAKVGIGRAHVRTPVTPRSTLFPYTTLFRSMKIKVSPARGGAGLITPVSERVVNDVRVRLFRGQGGDRESTRANSRHTEIYTLSLHDALPIYEDQGFSSPGRGGADYSCVGASS